MFAIQRRGDVVDAADHRSMHRQCRRSAATDPCHVFPRDREEVAEPATVAAAGAEAGDLAIHDQDAQPRLATEQCVGGPQPGETGTDDGNVDVSVTIEREPR